MNNDENKNQENKGDEEFNKHHSSLGNDAGRLNIENGRINDERVEKAFEDIREKPECALIMVVPKDRGHQKTIMMGSTMKITALLAAAAQEDPNFATALIHAAMLI